MDFSLESVLPFKATKSTELASPVFINCKLPTLNAVSLSKWILKECSPLSNKIFVISVWFAKLYQPPVPETV